MSKPLALILGATSDIGMAIARRLAAEGYDLQLAARKPELLEATGKDLAVRHQAKATLHHFDALDYAAHDAFWEGLDPKPQVVVYVIGYMQENEQAVQSWEEAEKTIGANYSGAVSILNKVALHFEKQGSGMIIGISSVAGLRGRQSNFIYGSAKAAFTAYLSGMRNRLYHKGVHVMTVLPGFVDTRMTAHLDLPSALTAQPAEVAHAIIQGMRSKKDVIYVRWIWRYIMMVITSIPEFLFKKRKL